jgi:hypothetical protein|nr:hypothetical protein [uncultured Acetatifactor sp.]
MSDEEFKERIEEVEAGYELWKSIVERYHFSQQDYVVVFPHEDDPVNECGIAHLRQFMGYAGGNRRILVLCIGNHVPEILCARPDEEAIAVEVIGEKEMESIVALYSISTISSHFIMMSLTRPYGRYGDKALDKGLTLDEVVTVGIYKMTGNEVFDRHEA